MDPQHPTNDVDFSLFFFQTLLQPSAAQFGVAGNRRQQGAAGTKFQDLQDIAKQEDAAGGGGMADLSSLLGDDPEMMKQYEAAMEQLAEMDPEQLQKQMAEAMNMLNDGDMMSEILKQKDEVLLSIEETGGVPPEEIEKMRADDAYFEAKMRESFGQMQEVFNNPEYLKLATDAMAGAADVMKNPEKAFEQLASTLGEIADDDAKIEEARLGFLEGDLSDNPLFAEAFKSDELQEVIADPTKWRESVKKGYQDMLGAAAGVKEEL